MSFMPKEICTQSIKDRKKRPALLFIEVLSKQANGGKGIFADRSALSVRTM